MYFPFKTFPAESISWVCCGLSYNTQDLLSAPAASVWAVPDFLQPQALGRRVSWLSVSHLLCGEPLPFVCLQRGCYWINLMAFPACTGWDREQSVSSLSRILQNHSLWALAVSVCCWSSAPKLQHSLVHGARWNVNWFKQCFHCNIRQTAQGCCDPFLSPPSSLTLLLAIGCCLLVSLYQHQCSSRAMPIIAADCFELHYLRFQFWKYGAGIPGLDFHRIGWDEPNGFGGKKTQTTKTHVARVGSPHRLP